MNRHIGQSEPMRIEYYAEGNCVFAQFGDRKWLYARCLNPSNAEMIARDLEDPPTQPIEYFADGNSIYEVAENGRESWVMNCETLEKAEQFAAVLNARLINCKGN